MSQAATVTVERLQLVTAEARACTLCAEHLEHGTRPVFQVGANARIVIIGQAPGRRVHESGIPWADPSGDRLRTWLGMDTQTFYNQDHVALLPMGFCYPGTGSSGDNPPRPECAPTWHPRILDLLPENRLTVLIGAYAQARYLPDRSSTLTETVRNWQQHLPVFVLPHPSPRNQRWLRANPWFETDVLPALRSSVAIQLDALREAPEPHGA
ncbi:uracil-DNA glycosylase family protein [Actinospongicola halichondriae]|uniref:uracil-DNA glycosylase family protein n=1 Tax=Actinospongicola halichondriae TaxID=3236844 RepID=UPI003D3B3122